jgi:hypothetical protein
MTTLAPAEDGADQGTEIDSPGGPVLVDVIDARHGADHAGVIEDLVGPVEPTRRLSAEEALAPDEDGAVRPAAIEPHTGPALDLKALTAAWEDVQRTRLALLQRGMAVPSERMKAIEASLALQVRREMERHPVWPWLSQYRGMGGVHVARLVAIIGDPHRFPGAVCPDGHHHRYDMAGIPCPVVLDDESVCLRTIGPRRQGTGVRSLWHYLGLHVVDGKSPRKRKGVTADWNMVGRTVCLMPGGIAEQIVRQRTETYRAIYDATKERLTRERGADGSDVLDRPLGPALHEVDPALAIDALAGLTSGSEVEDLLAVELARGLRPFQIDAIARKVAVKAFVGDLLREMQRSMP